MSRSKNASQLRKLDEAHQQWLWTRARNEDRPLFHAACDFEERYFDDMSLERYEEELTKFKVQGEDGKSHEVSGHDLLDSLWGAISFRWVVTYKTRRFLRNCSGRCDEGRRTIYVLKGLNREDEQWTLLHEMIHAYEVELLKYESYSQWLLLQLYGSMRRRLGTKKLDAMILADVHTDFHVHTPLFLLKSLDLDLRFKNPFGTVYGYGRPPMLEAVLRPHLSPSTQK